MDRQPTRVVLANDDPIVVEGLRALLEPYDEVQVVATALGDPEIALAGETEVDADVMLIDAFSRRAGGIEAAAKVLAQDPPFVVAVFTHTDDLRLMLQAVRIGVRGYLLKSAEPDELVAMLVRLHQGEIVVDARMTTDALVLAANTIDIGDWPGAHLGLTRREAQLLGLIGRGLTPRQAAGEMELSHETVRTHMRNLYRKLDVNDRAAAVAIAWREGLAR
jgi:DNA-binding NarL/FixJ family response regulator